MRSPLFNHRAYPLVCPVASLLVSLPLLQPACRRTNLLCNPLAVHRHNPLPYLLLSPHRSPVGHPPVSQPWHLSHRSQRFSQLALPPVSPRCSRPVSLPLSPFWRLPHSQVSSPLPLPRPILHNPLHNPRLNPMDDRPSNLREHLPCNRPQLQLIPQPIFPVVNPRLLLHHPLVSQPIHRLVSLRSNLLVAHPPNQVMCRPRNPLRSPLNPALSPVPSLLIVHRVIRANNPRRSRR